MDILISLIIAGAAGAIGFLSAWILRQNQLTAAQSHNAQTEAALRVELARFEGMEGRLKEKSDELQQLQTQMKEWMENTANRLLKNTAEQLATSSQQQMDALLNPVKERLSEFKTKVEEVHGKGIEQHVSLKTLIEQLHATHTTLHQDTANLTRALKGDSQKRGQWGEMRLETILQNSGLREGENYIRQGQDLGLKGDGGEHQRPDILVVIPQADEQRYVVVDSKVSLNSYVEWVNTDDAAPEKARLQKSFLDAVRAHVNDLAGKKYQDNSKLIAHDYVLMFIPNEAMFTAAVDLDASLFDYAWSRRVALVSPTTLMLTLSVVGSVWRMDRQQRNSNEIAEQAKGMIEKMAGVFEALEELGSQMRKSEKAYNNVISRLRDGRGNVLSKLEKIQTLGVKADKSLPELTTLSIDGNDSVHHLEES